MLAREGAAEARLCYTQAGTHPDCTGDGHGFRVYPPSAADSPCIHRPTTACSNTDTKLLTIGAFHP
ncbi:hypothetical protein ART_0925 [Arthrobacter sp. PAMC 25486]|uniref:hypothetical protein n=1 Tax=Arthrobacter sp. PAMC 25486 TaxID=1494608 RepID=UPI000535B2C7|nr:hypothetical protein [Arthrobacter sp. PAMC 25486]AIY00524.1 hypothetical protein ART_0925 [Arthrobacter sp. PAMC 25486]